LVRQKFATSENNENGTGYQRKRYGPEGQKQRRRRSKILQVVELPGG
jgi:hypothetical protein